MGFGKKDIKFENSDSERSSGGTGLVNLLVGFIVLGAGAYLVLQNTIISTQFSLAGILGFNPPFGLVLLPLLFGIGMLFFNSKSVLGWLLFIFGILTILLGILTSLRIYFKPVTLYQGILMFGMIAAGAGLLLRGFLSRK